MCGIVGVYGDAEPDLLSDMLSAITHRGPDGEGQFVAPNQDLAMGARRLSIVDLEGGSQPISNEDGSVTVVFNGEIYNHERFREELTATGHRFETRCDTEVLVHLWEEHGRRMTEHLDGMFAFSLVDENEDVLFLARDPLGIKPLFYTDNGDSLRWASELKPLLFSCSAPAVDEKALYNFFSLKYTPNPQTLVEGIHKLPPGSSLTISLNDNARQRHTYWDLSRETVNLGRASIASRVRNLLEAAVKNRLMGDVPVGAFLSGGLDSSAVVGIMAETYDEEVNTYSVTFNDGAYDESSEARYVAEHFGTNHTEVPVDLDSFDMFRELVTHFGEPIADPAALPTMLLAKYAARDLKTVLTGEGADELFAGYGYYRRWPQRRKLANMLPSPVYRVTRLAAPLLPDAYETYRQALRSDELLILHQGRQFGPDPASYLDTNETANSSGLRDMISNTDAYADTYSKRLATFDIKYWLPDDLLYKVDHSTMRSSLEARVPFLDTNLVEFMYGVDHKTKVGGGSYKPLLNRAVADIVPTRVRQRDKHGFNIPVDTWFREGAEVAGRWLSEEKIEATPYVSPESIFEILDDHQSGTDHGDLLWKLLTYIAWYHEVFHRYGRE